MKTSSKTIIGLTGNIATGKSVVRRMLVNHGALGIDADVIAHRVLYSNGSAYEKVVDAFGKQILSSSGEIAREKLAEIVFSSPNRLRELEELTHSAVTRAIQQRIKSNPLPLTVIEAIKLIESPLLGLCDFLWVSHITEAEQLNRLVEIRKMPVEDAIQRIAAQPPQSEKLPLADVVIHTEGSFENTWQQIHAALNDTIQIDNAPERLNINIVNHWWIQPAGCLSPMQVSAFIENNLEGQTGDFFEWLAFKVITPVMEDEEIRQLLVWEESNFTGKLEKIIPSPKNPEQRELAVMAFEVHALENQCELLIIPGDLAGLANSPSQHGFKQLQPGELTYPDWKQAVPLGQDVWIKIPGQPIEATDENFTD